MPLDNHAKNRFVSVRYLFFFTDIENINKRSNGCISSHQYIFITRRFAQAHLHLGFPLVQKEVKDITISETLILTTNRTKGHSYQSSYISITIEISFIGHSPPSISIQL